ncbi:polysaccharide deacetylase family protein [Paenibacillus soyae]|uniref:Polysaccharide deacetylase family protein n=1 Tax=Paenibacillus soyae TaxID=2969249 RepID=A0A9X2S7H0_9BACL|nr:polysaccharide deacetylase family protein [Paenibacillus soyae]MCR2803046.1 polysaccharide deacetylase family protein [Paenibacillus soyae]
MRKKWTYIIAAAMLIGLAGCSGGDADSVSITTPQAAVSAEPTRQADAPASVPAASPSPSEPAASPSPSPTAEEAPKRYRMSEAYRFVPIGDAPKKAVLLTFDDGPKDKEIITSILDTLDQHKAKAIFFVNGYRVDQNPELLKLIFERGGTIGNHSYDHINLKNEDEAVVEDQLSRVQRSVDDLVGSKPKFFRPPFGAGGDTVKKTAKNHGMLYMTWSNGSLDWDSSARDKPEVVIRNVMEQLHPGANILMHELPWTADALDELLTKIEAEGYLFIDPETIAITD